jgi:hypothetical protein
MRCLLMIAVLLLPLPALAWDVGRDGPRCTLTHRTAETTIRLTYDSGLPEYTIRLTRPGAPWPRAPVFALRFDGAQPNTISTSRHVLSDSDTQLMVTDRGFGNVLDGLQFNDWATAIIGDEMLRIPLDGAAPKVADFRACRAPLPVG